MRGASLQHTNHLAAQVLTEIGELESCFQTAMNKITPPRANVNAVNHMPLGLMELLENMNAKLDSFKN